MEVKYKTTDENGGLLYYTIDETGGEDEMFCMEDGELSSCCSSLTYHSSSPSRDSPESRLECFNHLQQFDFKRLDFKDEHYYAGFQYHVKQYIYLQDFY